MIQLPSTRLFWRVALYIGAALVAFVALAVTSFVILAADELESYTATRLSGLGREAADVLHAKGPDGLSRWLAHDARVPEDVTVYVLDRSGRDLLDRPLPPLYENFIRRAVVGSLGSTTDRYRRVRLAPLIVGPDGTSYAFLVLPKRIGVLGDVVTGLGLLGAALLVMATVAWLIARAFARPVAELQRTVRELASGEIGARVPLAIAARRDELGALAADVNSMADRISALLANRSRLISELSHELRSPLARLRASLALADQRRPLEPGEQVRVEQEIARMDGLIGDMLRYSRLEAAPLPVRKLLRVDTLLAELVRDEEVEASAAGCRLELATTSNPRVVGDPVSLRSAVENVLRNAIRHAPRDSSIEIAAHSDGNLLTIEIADRGPGVPINSLHAIFEPFVRGVSQPNEPQAGSGLGLAIAKRVIEAHDGTIAATLRQGGGLLVTMILPSARLD
jgi:two-component system sensor histidine kinase CpxA